MKKELLEVQVQVNGEPMLELTDPTTQITYLVADSGIPPYSLPPLTPIYMYMYMYIHLSVF